MGYAIGFTADRTAMDRKDSVAVDAAYEFDSGDCLSMEQMMRNTIILGQTGSGKTESMIYPICDHLLSKGLSGIIFDAKGTMRNDVYNMAAARGRASDIIEIGSSDSATPVNIFGGLPIAAIHDVIHYMATEGLQHDSNAVWNVKSADEAMTCLRLVRILSRIAPNCGFSRQFAPSLLLVDQIFKKRYLQWCLPRLLRAEIGRMADRDLKREAEELMAEIAENRFSILYPDEINDSKALTTALEQRAWITQRMAMRLRALQAARGLLSRFSDSSGLDGLDFRRLFAEGKVIVAHFSPDCGASGELMANVIKNLYYMSFMGTEPLDRPTFMLADEYQYLINVDRSATLNDMDVFCQSRQFKIINVVATQNVCSLYAAGEKDAVRALLSNCTNKVFLQNSDPETAAMRPDCDVARLPRGEAALETVGPDGVPVVELESMSKEYGRLRGVLSAKAWTRPAEAPRRPRAPMAASGLSEAVDDLMREAYGIATENPARAAEAASGLAEAVARMRAVSMDGGDYWEEDDDGAEADIARPRASALDEICDCFSRRV